jgi:hypothetical protein
MVTLGHLRYKAPVIWPERCGWLSAALPMTIREELVADAKALANCDHSFP